MANIPDGYGSIYCSSWWGQDGQLQQYIDRGVIIGGTCTDPDALLYEARVDADGGTIEALDCLSDELKTLKE